MSDDRAFDEPLPWLAPVEDEDEPRGISARRIVETVQAIGKARTEPEVQRAR